MAAMPNVKPSRTWMHGRLSKIMSLRSKRRMPSKPDTRLRSTTSPIWRISGSTPMTLSRPAWKNIMLGLSRTFLRKNSSSSRLRSPRSMPGMLNCSRNARMRNEPSCRNCKTSGTSSTLET